MIIVCLDKKRVDVGSVSGNFLVAMYIYTAIYRKLYIKLYMSMYVDIAIEGLIS